MTAFGTGDDQEELLSELAKATNANFAKLQAENIVLKQIIRRLIAVAVISDEALADRWDTSIQKDIEDWTEKLENERDGHTISGLKAAIDFIGAFTTNDIDPHGHPFTVIDGGKP
jgi:hypothetical protein